MPSIQAYKNTYFAMYGHYPSMKLIESYCRIYGIKEEQDQEVTQKDWEDFWNNY